MEPLLSNLWGLIFGWIPVHRYAARCICRAWRSSLGENHAAITWRTILEQAGDPKWQKGAIADWGQVQANELLEQAAAAGNEKGMELAKDWGATNFDGALFCAAANGQLGAMELAKEWGATNFNLALNSAASVGQLEAMELAKAWGAFAFNGALAHAAAEGQLEAMELLKKWGATE